MSAFGSHLRYYPKVAEYIKLRPLIKTGKFYIKMFSIFGISGNGAYLRSVYFRKCLKDNRLEFKSVLDAGCGPGNYSFYLAKKYPHVSIDACDFDKDAIKRNKNILNKTKIININFLKLNLVKFSEHEKYDLISSIDVLEHIEDDVTVVKNFYDSLKWGGALIIHTPQKKQRHILKNYAWKEKCPDHVKEGYSPDDMAQHLEKNGIAIIKRTNTFGIFGEFAYIIYLLLPKYLKPAFAILLNCVGYIDVLTHHKRGNGLLILAKKRC